MIQYLKLNIERELNIRQQYFLQGKERPGYEVQEDRLIPDYLYEHQIRVKWLVSMLSSVNIHEGTVNAAPI